VPHAPMYAPTRCPTTRRPSTCSCSSRRRTPRAGAGARCARRSASTASLAAGGKYKIQWKEAFGGQLYKANATLTSVEQGITDIGWVFSYLEPAKMPLAQLSAHTPFTTSDRASCWAP
jgi:hypothetical protein